MASNFKFKILTGANPKAQYDAITSKDPLTFYLLNNGMGYLGTVKLFDATEELELVTDMLAENFVPDDKSPASTKAIVDYVADKVEDVTTLLTHAFFRKVESHTVTAEDLTNPAISMPEGVKEGDVGLLFTADTDSTDGGETFYFISLVDYLQAVYTYESTKTIEMAVSPDNKVTANLKIKAGEESIKVDEENGGIYIDKTEVINDGDGTDKGGVAPSATKLVTEQSLVNYVVNSVLPAVNNAIAEALRDVVTAAIDDGTETEE